MGSSSCRCTPIPRGSGRSSPADALASLLLIAGIAARLIPPGLEARAGRWRDYLAGKKILLLLDDAAGHEQVRPLLPGTAGQPGAGHQPPAADGAGGRRGDQPGYPATRMKPTALLVRLGGPARAAVRATPGWRRSPGCAGTCRWRSGCSPANCATTRLDPGRLAAELAAARDRLALMRAEDLSVAAAFDLSYADLTAGQQRLFRRLGLIPGSDFDAYAAAALDGTSLDAARRHLDDLYDQHLISEPAAGRYRLHDLLREHARALAGTDEPADSGRRHRPVAGLLPAHRPGRQQAHP